MNNITIIKPDDWHLHLREGDMMDAVLKDTVNRFKRCIAMPNLKNPIVNWNIAKKYKNLIENKSLNKLEVFIPCYLTDNIDLLNFEEGIKKKYFVGAKLYPVNSTTNSNFGVNKIENIFPALEILEKNNAPLLIHGEKVNPNISIFDREKYFIDEELYEITKRFQNLKIVLEHISSSYGADYVAQSNLNIASTITLHHLILTKKDVFNGEINPDNYCMPVVKDENDLITLRKYACSGNKKFFLGTDSAPHDSIFKKNDNFVQPGIFTSPVSIEMYASVFEEENALDKLEKFSSINGAEFYNLPQNKELLNLIKKDWINSEFTNHKELKIKNFMGGNKIKWKILN